MTMQPPYHFNTSSLYPPSSNNETPKVPSTSTGNFPSNNLRFLNNFSSLNVPHTSIPRHSNLDPKVFPNSALHRFPNACINKFNSEQLPPNHNPNSRFAAGQPPPSNAPFPVSTANYSDHNMHNFPSPPIPPACFLPPDKLNVHNLNQQSSLTVSRQIPNVQNFGNNTNFSEANFIHSNQQTVPSAQNFSFHQPQTSFQSRFQIIHNYNSGINNVPIQSNVRSALPVMSENSLIVPRNTENVMSMPRNALNPNLQGHSNLSIIPESIERNHAIRPVVPAPIQIPPPIMHSGISLYLPPPPISRNSYSSPVLINNTSHSLLSEKEWKLSEFLSKFVENEKKRGNSQVSIPEFRSILIAGFSVSKELLWRRKKLTELLDSDNNTWIFEMNHISNLKDKLSEICSFLNAPLLLSKVMKKLKIIKKKREQKKKTKLNTLSEKVKAIQRRENCNQEIDKWLDDIKEKNMKLKREAEMKKEADYILLEVRKKIHEAKRTIEKIKVFEKLRNVRQANAVKKGLHITSEHNENFERKISILKRTMLKQLADYEAEEKALKVMLETEQEGQLEEETQWKIKKAKMLQHKKHKFILECLFGISGDPQPTDALYLFHKFHTSANNSIENLVQIRHQWDVYLADDGESVPQQWVLPTSASDSFWEQCLTPSGISKN